MTFATATDLIAALDKVSDRPTTLFIMAGYELFSQARLTRARANLMMPRAMFTNTSGDAVERELEDQLANFITHARRSETAVYVWSSTGPTRVN